MLREALEVKVRWAYLEDQDTEKVRPPDELEPDRNDLPPAHTILGHAPPRDADEVLDAV